MNNKIVESREIVWSENNDRYILIIKENDEIVGLNYMQGDALGVFKRDCMYVDEELTDFYNAVEPYLDDRNDEIGKINAAIWAFHEYRVLRDERKYNNNNK